VRCLRCGYCCTKLVAVIVIDPDAPEVFAKENLRGINMLEERCPHLRGDKPGEYSCAVHDRTWFSETPCAEYQSHWPTRVCGMGSFSLGKT
jgi:hypothetical protein